MNNAIRIVDGIYWVGSRDPELRSFDLVMNTAHGSTYNAYVVEGEDAVALVETTKHGFEEGFLASLREVVDPAKIDYLIVNHTEPDHSGAVAELLDAAPQVTVVGTRRALQFLEQQQNRSFPSRAVKAGDTLELGGRTLSFLPSPFLHWPDTMFTYVAEDKLLFSCDVFGTHYCPETTLFDDELSDAQRTEYESEFGTYYQAILSPYAGHVKKGLAKLEGLTVETICPSHGPVLRRDPSWQIARYREWAAGVGEGKRAAVCFASIYGFTKQLAETFAEALSGEGVETQLIDIETTAPAEVVAACWRAGAVFLGSPTINGAPAPQVHDVLGRLDPYHTKGKLFVGFGSYGWSGEAVELMNARALELKMRLLDGDKPGLQATFRPTEEDLEAAREMAKQVAAAL